MKVATSRLLIIYPIIAVIFWGQVYSQVIDLPGGIPAEDSIKVRLRYEEGLAAYSKALLGEGDVDEIINRALLYLV